MMKYRGLDLENVWLWPWPWPSVTSLVSVVKSSTGFSGREGLRCGAFTCVGWQVTLLSHMAGDAPYLCDWFPAKICAIHKLH